SFGGDMLLDVLLKAGFEFDFEFELGENETGGTAEYNFGSFTFSADAEADDLLAEASYGGLTLALGNPADRTGSASFELGGTIDYSEQDGELVTTTNYLNTEGEVVDNYAVAIDLPLYLNGTGAPILAIIFQDSDILVGAFPELRTDLTAGQAFAL